MTTLAELYPQLSNDTEGSGQPFVNPVGAAPSAAAPAPAFAPLTLSQRFQAGAHGQNPYEFQAQRAALQAQMEAQRSQQQNQDAQTEMNFAKAWETSDPGSPMRKAVLGGWSRWSIAKGKPIEQSLLDFMSKADVEEIAATKYVNQVMIPQMFPNADPQEVTKWLNGTPAGNSKLFNMIAQAQQHLAQTEKIKAETKAKDTESKLMESAMQALSGAQGMTSPGDGSQVQSMPIVPPGGSQGPQMGTQPAMAIRNNNPGNIKLGPLTMKWVQQGVATPAEQGQDGGRFLRFASADAGFQAAQDLLQQPFYADKTVEDAMRAWSNGGYGADVAPGIAPTAKVGSLPPQQKQQLVQGIAKREGFSLGGRPASGATLSAPPEYQQRIAQLNQRIEAQQAVLSRLAGLAANPNTNRVLEFLTGQITRLQAERDSLVKQTEPKSADLSVQSAGMLGVSPNPALRTREEATAVKDLSMSLEAEQAQRKAEATAPTQVKVQAAQGENAARLAPLEDAHLYLDENKEPVGVSTRGELLDLNKQRKDAGLKPVVKWKDLDAKREGEMNEQLSAVKNTERILALLADPTAAKFIGTLFSNPGPGWEKRVANVFGGRLPEQYREMAAEMAGLTSQLLHARIGGQQTVQEFKRLEPFIPSVNDVDATTVKAKLRVIRNTLAEDFNTRLDTFDKSKVLAPWQKMPLLERQGGQPAAPAAAPIDPAVQKLLDTWNSKD